jgi:uncharacterized protein (TIGR03437 family)
MQRVSLTVFLLLGTAAAQPPSVASFGYSQPNLTAVAPGQITTLLVQGLAANLDRPLVSVDPLPTSVAGITVHLRQSLNGYTAAIPVPILSVQRLPEGCDTSSAAQMRYSMSCAVQITIQLPYELAPGSPVAGSLLASSLRAALVVAENGVEGPPIPVLPLFDQVHVVDQCDVMFVKDVNATPMPCGPVITHGSGTRVSREAPAREGETITMYALGLGLTTPAAKTGQRSVRADVVSPERLRIGVVVEPNGSARPTTHPVTGEALPGQIPAAVVYAGLVEGYVGLYQINFTVPQLPPDAPSCDNRFAYRTNVTVSIGTANGYSGGGVCVAR